MNTAKLLLTILTTTTASGAFAQLPQAVSQTERGATGICFEDLGQPAQPLLAKYGIGVRTGTLKDGAVVQSANPTSQLAANAARLLQRVDSLTGGKGLGRLDNLILWDVPNLDADTKETAQTMSFKSTAVDNMAHIAHELSHRFADLPSNKPGKSWQARYVEEVGERCLITDLCRAESTGAPRGEEFAEAFAAYVAHPALLKNGPPACRKAYEFFRKEMLPGKETSCANGQPIKVAAPALTPKDEKCDDPANPLGGNGQDIQRIARTAQVASHVDERARARQERLQEEREERAEEAKEAREKAAKQARMARDKEQAQVTRTFATFISFVPAVTGIYLQNKMIQDYSNAQVQLYTQPNSVLPAGTTYQPYSSFQGPSPVAPAGTTIPSR